LSIGKTDTVNINPIKSPVLFAHVIPSTDYPTSS